MKILITDDKSAHLDAARVAAEAFPEHEFLYASTGAEALALAEQVDAVITDFFYPLEEGVIDGSFASYLAEISRQNPVFAEISKAAKEDLEVYLERFEEWVAHLHGGDLDWRYYSCEYGDLFEGTPEFLGENRGYGALVAMRAEERGIPYVIVTDMHRHALGVTSVTPVSGAALLMPLIQRGMVTIEEVNLHRGRHYIGSWGGGSHKQGHGVWDIAIRKVLGIE